MLKPASPKMANAKSLSAVYGRGQQPLHTDGAHLSEPPDILILSAVAPTSVPTLLWRHMDLVSGLSELDEDIRHGLFTVDDGASTFLAPARTGWTETTARLRYDPGCMTPADSRAQRVSAHFEGVVGSATAFEWTHDDQILVIDNRSVLHARANAVADPDREMRRLMLQINQNDET